MGVPNWPWPRLPGRALFARLSSDLDAPGWPQNIRFVPPVVRRGRVILAGLAIILVGHSVPRAWRSRRSRLFLARGVPVRLVFDQRFRDPRRATAKFWHLTPPRTRPLTDLARGRTGAPALRGAVRLLRQKALPAACRLAAETEFLLSASMPGPARFAGIGVGSQGTPSSVLCSAGRL